MADHEHERDESPSGFSAGSNQDDRQRSPSGSSLATSISSASLQKSDKSIVHVPCYVKRELHLEGLQVDDYGVVRWQENSHAHPRQWSLGRKAYDSGLICFLEFFVTLISNTGSSIALEQTDFDIGRTTALVCFTSVYMIGQALGGLVFPPIAESFGGRTVYVTTTFGYAIFCLLIAAWPILPVVVICRFGSGFLSAMPAVVAVGSIENMWDVRARIWLIHLWIATAVLGLALGPPSGDFCEHFVVWMILSPIVLTVSRQWIFYIASAIAAVSTLLCMKMKESRPSQLLKQRVKIVARNMGFDGLSCDDTDSIPDFRTFVKASLSLPMRLFFTEPIVMLTSIMAATVYGVTYLFSEAFPVIYTEGWGFSHREASLVFIAIAAGLAFTFLPRLFDIRVTNGRRRADQVIEPEDKLFGFYVAAPVLAIGLWWFAATVPPLVRGITPWASIISVGLFGFAVVEFDAVLSGYLTDTYASYAGSANAPMAFLRAMFSAVFPLFGTQMFERLGANYALFILAVIATAYCAVAGLFGAYGKRIRQRSPFAERTWAVTVASQQAGRIATSLQEPEKCLDMGRSF
ncbi:Major facilitator superfamily multidrug transporter mdrA [Fulvia fulva]|uniref:Major facilitator superfamily multidrug transporter mdrA n=1 Tax=Passalora fulva TaxID=5499 RepID=A0A9Q8L7V0_PASFU|nr:Major facilitator superfamily multidrug transporter mdrA [Fulvia fulva]KAK4634838.1 Major facilitator superfamily multidrug transporter mdrA [Fulvia fulva]UJO12472.1 Major facilitator superfamily multidrug transporter mdrA [Fulvia fulva]WPV10073.1 Major facilitator superfamily multidrug transporter mdrA [Fulvia fulva]WPV24056.1 Major facilitator superfamily multidrug transporter mdrA [Fulvia fulva]